MLICCDRSFKPINMLKNVSSQNFKHEGAYSSQYFLPNSTNEHYLPKPGEWCKNVRKNYKFVAFVVLRLIFPIDSCWKYENVKLFRHEVHICYTTSAQMWTRCPRMYFLCLDEALIFAISFLFPFFRSPKKSFLKPSKYALKFWKLKKDFVWP